LLKLENIEVKDNLCWRKKWKF